MIFSKNFRAKGAKWYQQQCSSSFMKKISKIFQKVTGSCMFKSELNSFFEKNSVLRFLGWRGPKCFSVFMNKKFLKIFWFFAWRSCFLFSFLRGLKPYELSVSWKYLFIKITSSIIKFDCGTKVSENYVCQSVSCFKLIRVVNSWSNEKLFSDFLWLQCHILLLLMNFRVSTQSTCYGNFRVLAQIAEVSWTLLQGEHTLKQFL